MPYSNFTLKKFLNKFNLETQSCDIFPNGLSKEPSNWLKESLQNTSNFPINTEKARSEAIVAPILYEITKLNPKINLFSGESLNANFELELNGECDFILTGEHKPILESPILGLVEAKKDDIPSGLGQCAAQMLGARIINEQDNKNIQTIYGCVTTGEIWQFMKLENNTVWIDQKKYYIDRVELILGVLQWIVDQYVLV